MEAEMSRSMPEKCKKGENNGTRCLPPSSSPLSDPVTVENPVPVEEDIHQTFFTTTLSLDQLREQRDKARLKMMKYQQAERVARNQLEKVDEDNESSAEEGEMDIESKLAEAARRKREEYRVQHLHILRMYQAHRLVHDFLEKLLGDAVNTFKNSGKRPNQTHFEYLNKDVPKRKSSSPEGDPNTVEKKSRVAYAMMRKPRFESIFDKFQNQVSFFLTLSLDGLREQEAAAKRIAEERQKDKLDEKRRLDEKEKDLEKLRRSKARYSEPLAQRYKRNRAHYKDALEMYEVHQDVHKLTKRLSLDAQEIFGSDFEKCAEDPAHKINFLEDSTSLHSQKLPEAISKLRKICPEHVHLWLLSGFKSTFTTEDVEDLEKITGRGLFGEGKRVADVINNYVQSAGYALALENKKKAELEALGLTLSSSDSEDFDESRDTTNSEDSGTSEIRDFETSTDSVARENWNEPSTSSAPPQFSHYSQLPFSFSSSSREIKESRKRHAEEDANLI